MIAGPLRPSPRKLGGAGSDGPLARWARDLAAWCLPASVTDTVDESPWVLPTEVFSRRADRQLANPAGASYARAMEALPSGGSVIDIGAGGGVASLPLAPTMTQLTAVDTHQGMLDDLARRAAPLSVEPHLVTGAWPDVADQVPVADLVLCHHVLYNVADLAPFVAELTAHARRRVVVEITARHPLIALNPYWQQFHHLTRPSGPSAEQAIQVLESLGLTVHVDRWTAPPEAEHASFATLVDVTRRRLCLPPERADDVAAALRRNGIDERQPPDLGSSGPDRVTLCWPGTAV
jgi:SAM-dependent methyltransferase